MGAWTCSAWRAAAASADLSGLAITMTGADANNSCATPSAITSGVPVSTEVAAAGRWVCDASATAAGGSFRATLEQDVAPAQTIASSASTAPAARSLLLRPLPACNPSTRHLGGTS